MGLAEAKGRLAVHDAADDIRIRRGGARAEDARDDEADERREERERDGEDDQVHETSSKMLSSSGTPRRRKSS